MECADQVPAFEGLDATSKKVIDGAHSAAYYWVGKNKTGVLFTGGPGGNYGMDVVDFIGWMYEGGGLELYQQFYKDVLKLNVVALPALPTGPQAFGWFKRPIKNLADFKRMKCRQTGINAEVFTEMGMRTVNLPGGEILPAAERGVIDCAEWVGGVEDLRLGFHNVWKYHYTPSMHEPVLGDDGSPHPLVREVAEAERRGPPRVPGEAQGQRSEDAKQHPDRGPQGPGQDRGARGGEGPLLQEGPRVPAPARAARRARQAVPVPGLRLAANHYWPEKKAAAAPAPASAPAKK